MASFVVETHVPGGDPDCFAVDVEGIRSAAAAAVTRGGRVRHVRSYLVPSDEMGFHVIEADSATDVAHVTDRARIEVERIVRAIGIGPGEGATDGRGSWNRLVPFSHGREIRP